MEGNGPLSQPAPFPSTRVAACGTVLIGRERRFTRKRRSENSINLPDANIEQTAAGVRVTRNRRLEIPSDRPKFACPIYRRLSFGQLTANSVQTIELGKNEKSIHDVASGCPVRGDL